MAVIYVDYPSEKELQWLSNNIGERLSYLPHHIGGTGWRYKRTYKEIEGKYSVQWTLEFDDDKMASYYVLRFK